MIRDPFFLGFAIVFKVLSKAIQERLLDYLRVSIIFFMQLNHESRESILTAISQKKKLNILKRYSKEVETVKKALSSANLDKIIINEKKNYQATQQLKFTPVRDSQIFSDIFEDDIK